MMQLVDLAKHLGDQWAFTCLPKESRDAAIEDYARRWAAAYAELRGYGLDWTWRIKEARIFFDDLRAVASDHALLSFWALDREQGTGIPKALAHGTVTCYTMAVIEATDALVRELNARVGKLQADILALP